MFKGIRAWAALGAALSVAIGVSACGGIPGDAVVSVGGQSITKAQFNHWMTVAALAAVSSEGAKKGAKPAAPEPPDYAACIAHLEATAPKPAKGKKPTVSAAQYKSQCEQQYTAYKQEVLDFLISAQWVLAQASEEGVSVSQKEVQKQFTTLKTEQFQKEQAFKEFLATHGETEADLMMRVKLQLLAKKIQEKVSNLAKKKPSKAEIQKYYSEHQSSYGKPERRDIQLILVKSEGAAKAAKAEVQAGKSFASVAGRVSTDPLTKRNGGTLNEVTRGEEEKAFDEAIFSAKVGVLSGPVKTPFGYYVFKVTKILPSTKEPLSQAESSISQQISSQSEQKALTSFITEFRKKWTARTECRTGYVVPDCKEYKAPKASTGSPTGSPTPGG